MAGDWIAAANCVRLALALAPDRADLKQRYAALSQRVAASLAGSYEKQARYEERAGKWEAAALAWSRVSDGRPEMAAPARAAGEAWLRAGQQLRQAQRYAQRAVDLEPKGVANLVLLARVYLAAGLPKNARGQLQRAQALDASHPDVQELFKEVG